MSDFLPEVILYTDGACSGNPVAGWMGLRLDGVPY